MGVYCASHKKHINNANRLLRFIHVTAWGTVHKVTTGLLVLNKMAGCEMNDQAANP